MRSFLILSFFLVSVTCSTERKAGELPGDEEIVADYGIEYDSGSDDYEGTLFEALSCPDKAGTKKNLREKAEYFDAVARKWHLPPGQELLYSMHLKKDLEAPDKVGMSDNVGSWTAMYAASQSFRYAATGDQDALENLRRVIKGEHNMLKITGVKGLFTRVYINPALAGFPTAEQLNSWYPDCDLKVKHCKRFNEVTEGEFKGFWFKNDVSKDEYAAHMFSMAVAWEIVSDPEVRARVKEIVTAVGDHLIDNGLRITDIDGAVTTFGNMYAMAFDDFPGFNALLTLSWIKLAAVVAGKKYEDFYEKCLLQQNGYNPCVPDEEPAPYIVYLDNIGLNLDCLTNWNNHNMAQIAMYSLIRYEEDPALKAVYREALLKQLWDADDPRPMRVQRDTLYTFFYLVNRGAADPPCEGEAIDAICSMKLFPEFKGHHAVDTVTGYKEVCKDRSGEPMSDVVIDVDKRASDNYMWSDNPYIMEIEAENLQIVESPEDYLLAYWMGRYFGFITEGM